MTVYWQSVLYLTICSGEVGRIQNVICGFEIYLAELFSLQQIFAYLVIKSVFLHMTSCKSTLENLDTKTARY